MKILIVEDDAQVASLLGESVTSLGHEALVIVNPEDALGVFTREQPDAVFLDIVMPRKTGIDVLREIRAVSPQVPVIVITGYATPEEIQEAKRLGATEVIEKPMILRQLDTALRAIRPPSENEGR